MDRTAIVNQSTAKSLLDKRIDFVATFNGIFWTNNELGYSFCNARLADVKTVDTSKLAFESVAVNFSQSLKKANLKHGDKFTFTATIVNSGVFIPIYQLSRISKVLKIQGTDD